MDKIKNFLAILIIAILPFAAAGQQQDRFVINGKIQSDTLSTGKIYLSWNDNGLELRDSASIENNTYHFSDHIMDGAVKVSLFWNDRVKGVPLARMPMKGFAQFYVGPSKVNVTHQSDFKVLCITGSSAQDDQVLLEKQLKAGPKENTGIKMAFIEAHPQSWISYTLLKSLVSTHKIGLDAGDRLYASLDPALKKFPCVTDVEKILVAGRKILVGNPAIEFTEHDVDGKPVSLSSYRGKYVLVDFWASWCHPCRDENPFLLKVFNKYKDKNFEVLGVSLDTGPLAKKLWTDAIRKDGLTWTQVLTLKGFDSEVVKKYGITAIPRNFLISPEGVIVAMDLRGLNLEQKMDEIFGTK